MAFLGNVEFVEGRSASKTTAMVLQKCLGCSKQDEVKAIGDFLEGLKIRPDAFFRDIDGDWDGRPFIGAHVYKIVLAAGYEGTEHDLWQSVTGDPAPYAVKVPKAARPKKVKAPKETAAQKAQGKVNKAARHRAIKEAWASRG